jgi:hypothetical protein
VAIIGNSANATAGVGFYLRRRRNGSFTVPAWVGASRQRTRYRYSGCTKQSCRNR